MRMFDEVWEAGDIKMAIILLIIAIIYALPQLLMYRQGLDRDKRIDKLDIQNKNMLNKLIDADPTITAMREKADRDFERLNSLERDNKEIKSGVDDVKMLTLLQCVYQTPTSREKHIYIIRRCHEYLQILKSRNETDPLAVTHLQNLEKDLALRDSKGDWEYKSVVPTDTPVPEI